MNLKVSDIIKATGGRGQDIQDSSISGISIDTRSIKKGEAFLAIKGDRFDGHNFLNEAVLKGASCLILTHRRRSRIKRIRKIIPKIFVENTCKALGDIAHYYRMRYDIPVIAITGSTGKTTVKEIVSVILDSRFNVLKTEGTKNNLIGVPLTLLGLNSKHDICVLEMGTNRAGEIKRLSEIAYPSVGVITNIGHSHLEYLGSIRNVYKTKSALLETLNSDGYAVLNKDDVFLAKAKTSARKVFFSIKSPSHFKARGVTSRDNMISFNVKGVRFSIPLLARHNIYNVLTGIAVADIFGIGMRASARILRHFQNPLNNRLALYKARGIAIINDTYNSNPLSFQGAVESLKGIGYKKRRVIVSSDMLELGERSKYFHRQAGRIVAESGIDVLVTVGRMSEYTGKGARLGGMLPSNIFHYRTSEELKTKLENIINKGDVVLVKGSRSMHMERVVADLKSVDWRKMPAAL